MALSDKDIVITPSKGSAVAAPKIVFSAASSSISAQDITLEVSPNGGSADGSTLTFTGEVNGPLLSLSDVAVGSLFSVSGENGLPLLDVSETGNISLGLATGALGLPSGTTAQRPTNPSGGWARWNSSNSAMEVYNGTEWVELISDYAPSGSTILG